ncbi:MAG: hypothetical protein JW913_07165 [Chitinispirillaceae bacterium]|nr:hypothetical protein [Chitinispirillaceae bacterium]
MLEKIAAEQKDKVTVYKINIDKNPEIAGALGVTGIPFVVFVKNREGVYALTGVQVRRQNSVSVLTLEYPRTFILQRYVPAGIPQAIQVTA